jgi:hypothetical protein
MKIETNIYLKCIICNKPAASIQENCRSEKLGCCSKHYWQYENQEVDGTELEFGEWAKKQMKVK